MNYWITTKIIRLFLFYIWNIGYNNRKDLVSNLPLIPDCYLEWLLHFVKWTKCPLLCTTARKEICVHLVLKYCCLTPLAGKGQYIPKPLNIGLFLKKQNIFQISFSDYEPVTKAEVYSILATNSHQADALLSTHYSFPDWLCEIL